MFSSIIEPIPAFRFAQSFKRALRCQSTFQYFCQLIEDKNISAFHEMYLQLCHHQLNDSKLPNFKGRAIFFIVAPVFKVFAPW